MSVVDQSRPTGASFEVRRAERAGGPRRDCCRLKLKNHRHEVGGLSNCFIDNCQILIDQ